MQQYNMNEPKWVVLQVTEKCNLRCKMCYEWGDNGSYLHKHKLNNLSVHKVNEIFENLKGYNVYYELFGGEPMLHPQFVDILSIIKKHNCTVDIPTNGTLLSKYYKEVVDANIRRIWISLDGPQEVNDAQRGKNVYARATEGIRLLQEHKKASGKTYPLVGVTFVVTPDNYKYLKSFYEMEVSKMGVDYFSIEFQLFITEERYKKYQCFIKEKFGLDNAWASKGLVRKLEQFKDIDVEYLVAVLNGIKKDIAKTETQLIGYPKYIDIANINKFYHGDWDNMKEARKNCPFPWVYMEISASGVVTPCHTFYDIEMGNVNDTPIMEIWESEKFKDLRIKMRNCITPICFACSRYYN